jgi:hypothetical protein
MPVMSCSLNNKPGWKWGRSGECYIYDPNSEISIKRARDKARRQGIAIIISQQKNK